MACLQSVFVTESPAGLTSTRTSLNKKHSGELPFYVVDVVVIPSGWMLLAVTVIIHQCRTVQQLFHQAVLFGAQLCVFICWTWLCYTRSGLHSISQHDLGVSTLNAQEWPRHTIPSLLSGSLRPGCGLAGSYKEVTKPPHYSGYLRVYPDCLVEYIVYSVVVST